MIPISFPKLIERELGGWLTIDPLPMRFKNQSHVPDGMEGTVIGLCKSHSAAVVRANYPVRGDDIWAISFDNIEVIKDENQTN